MTCLDPTNGTITKEFILFLNQGSMVSKHQKFKGNKNNYKNHKNQKK